MHKEVATMTVAEALEQGYSQVVQDGGDYAEDLDDVDPEELQENTYWILEKESQSYQLGATSIKDMVSDDVCGQDVVCDDDGELVKLVDSIPVEAFEAITKLINEKLAERRWWPATNIRLEP